MMEYLVKVGDFFKIGVICIVDIISMLNRYVIYLCVSILFLNDEFRKVFVCVVWVVVGWGEFKG